MVCPVVRFGIREKSLFAEREVAMFVFINLLACVLNTIRAGLLGIYIIYFITFYCSPSEGGNHRRAKPNDFENFSFCQLETRT